MDKYLKDLLIMAIPALIIVKVFESKAKNLLKGIVTTAMLAVVAFFVSKNHGWLGFASATADGGEKTKNLLDKFSAFHWPSLLQIILALVCLVGGWFWFKKTMLPKEWSAEKDDDGKIIEVASTRWSAVLSVCLTTLSVSLLICWPGVVYFWGALVCGLALDIFYIVPYLHLYAVLIFQKPVWFWNKGLHLGLPSWLPRKVFEILNLRQEKVEASFETPQLATADTPVTLLAAISKRKGGKSAKAVKGSEDAEADVEESEDNSTFSATISWANWVVFVTNKLPKVFIRYSRTDRDQLKEIVFNAISAFEAEILLGLSFMEARLQEKQYVTMVEVQQEAANAGRLAQFEVMKENNASDSDWLSFAKQVFCYDKKRVQLFERFLTLRSRLMIQVGVELEDIRVPSRKAVPEVEELLNAVTVAKLKLQEARIGVDIGTAEGDKESQRQSRALEGVFTLLGKPGNARLMLLWSDYQKSINNRNVNIGNVDLGAIAAQLAQQVTADPSEK